LEFEESVVAVTDLDAAFSLAGGAGGCPEVDPEGVFATAVDLDATVGVASVVTWN
jgi:hypothetical protein